MRKEEEVMKQTMTDDINVTQYIWSIKVLPKNSTDF